MTLTPGTRLGPYEIASALGEGGMGEMYLATDTSLGHQVALEVLPAFEAVAAGRMSCKGFLLTLAVASGHESPLPPSVHFPRFVPRTTTPVGPSAVRAWHHAPRW
jgi:hypothetical protein